MKIPLVGEVYTPRSLAVGCQTCINLYPEEIEDPNERGKNKAALFGTPGHHLFKDLTTIDAAATPLRGLWSGGGRLFAAAGTKYMELDSTGALVGSVRTISNTSVNGLSNSPVQFFPNGNQLFIVSGGRGYIDNGGGPSAIAFSSFSGTVNTSSAIPTVSGFADWVSGDKFDPGMVGGSITINAVGYTVAGMVSNERLVIISDPGTQAAVAYSASAPTLGAVTGGFLNSAFFVNRPLSRQVNFSAVNNGNSWNGLDFISKDSWPDHVRSILVHEEQLYLFGDESFEVWQGISDPTTNTPFQRIDGAGGRYGSVSPWGPIAINGKVYFVGGNSTGAVVAYVLNGFSPVRISTHAEESQWNAAALGPNCISYTYTEEGHTFWVINFGSQTWVYDTVTGAWHTRKSWNGSAFTTYTIKYHAFIPEFGNGKHLVGGSADGKIYEASVNFYDDAGADRAWERTLPHLYNIGNRLYFGRMTLEMETGTTPSGSPTIARTYSDDRGNTFGNSVTAGIGTNGQNSVRVFWPTNGSSYDRVFRLSGSGQYKVALVDLELELEVGAN